MKTDNRWPVGSLESQIPDDARAVYSARWIDHDTTADVVPDRQGFAYDDAAERNRLIDLMNKADLRRTACALDRDVAVQIANVNLVATADDFHVWMRRSGGYVYVAAWIN